MWASLGNNWSSAADGRAAPTDAWQQKGLWFVEAGGADASGVLNGHPTIFDGPFSWPMLTLNIANVSHNINTLAQFCERHGLQLAPHGKTTMMPGIFRMQLDAGAWGITVANAHQALVCREFGIPRVILANEVLDRRAVRWLVREHSAEAGFEILPYVDSLAGAQLLTEVAAEVAPVKPMRVLIEIGYQHGRAGSRSFERSTMLAQELRKSPYLVLAGVGAYEGSLRIDEVQPLFDDLKQHLYGLHDLGLFDGVGDVIVTVGGSKYFDLVAKAFGRGWEAPFPAQVILRSGSYVTHDDLYYSGLTPFNRVPQEGSLRSALTLWSQVLSAPEPGLAICGFGRRDVSVDQGYPIAKHLWRQGVTSRAAGHRVLKLNDQHAFLAVEEEQLLVESDVLGFGISHPCTTIDRWRRVIVVDHEYHALGVLTTYF